jgi:hypothetical protein
VWKRKNGMENVTRPEARDFELARACGFEVTSAQNRATSD